MKIHASCNPMPKTDLGEILGKNSLQDGLVKPVYKFAKSVTETRSKL